MDINETELLADLNTPGNEARKAFLKGYAETAGVLRRQNLELARTGSPAADETCRDYMKEMTRSVTI